ncbi:MAG: hypothetical protein WKF76_02590, partial [Nocardioidaceae bacterium]
MSRHGRLRQPQVFGQIPDLVLAQSQMPQDGKPVRVTEAAEHASSRPHGLQLVHRRDVCGC